MEFLDEMLFVLVMMISLTAAWMDHPKVGVTINRFAIYPSPPSPHSRRVPSGFLSARTSRPRAGGALTVPALRWGPLLHRHPSSVTRHLLSPVTTLPGCPLPPNGRAGRSSLSAAAPSPTSFA